MNKKDLVLSAITVLISVIIVTVAVKAATGGLNPPNGAFDAGAPQGTMHTLDDIYNSITPPLAWSVDHGYYLCWNASYAVGCTAGSGLLDPTGTGSPLLGAIEYCNYLEADGTTIAATPQNIWRLPSEGELLQGLSQGYLESSTGGGFQDSYLYWSSTPFAAGPGYAWVAYDGGGVVFDGNGGESNGYLVRCVH